MPIPPAILTVSQGIIYIMFQKNNGLVGIGKSELIYRRTGGMTDWSPRSKEDLEDGKTLADLDHSFYIDLGGDEDRVTRTIVDH